MASALRKGTGVVVVLADVARILYRLLSLWSNADFLVNRVKGTAVETALTTGGVWLDVVLLVFGLVLLGWTWWPRNRSVPLEPTAPPQATAHNWGPGLAVGVNSGTINQFAAADPAERNRIAKRWRQLIPQIEHWIGAGRRIEEEMRNETNPEGTLDAYVRRLEPKDGWRTLTARFLDAEFPNTGLRGLIIVKGTTVRGLPPFPWELERLSVCIARLVELKQPGMLDYYIHLSGKYN